MQWQSSVDYVPPFGLQVPFVTCQHNHANSCGALVQQCWALLPAMHMNPVRWHQVTLLQVVLSCWVQWPCDCNNQEFRIPGMASFPGYLLFANVWFFGLDAWFSVILVATPLFEDDSLHVCKLVVFDSWVMQSLNDLGSGRLLSRMKLWYCDGELLSRWSMYAWLRPLSECRWVYTGVLLSMICDSLILFYIYTYV